MGNRRLGKSAIVVSDICMGTMTFGSQADEAAAHRVLDMSLDADAARRRIAHGVS